MKIIKLVVILLFNCVGGLLSYQWCYRFIKKQYNTPEYYYLIYYGLCYFCFILISIFILNKIKKSSGLVICGLLIGILISLIFMIIRQLIQDPYLYQRYLINLIGIDLLISSWITLNFIIYPAILLCCHYSIFLIEKIYSKISLN
ncbi:hypothetical protein GA0061081_10192 [Gilliamella bombicola]|uniref:Uncharacterized protein n=1 Tax=Gilliamella bombicola TaxID=1798182 RepID=A0A1C3YSE4_9GAMM|nr:hypothetical protein [Gilliamella sp. ESL0254]NUF27463.1 hypothetical protein [Gilliamella sp. ESL0254]SCB73017.1 hypothetical protein GA0061081_10192 [Gilliamella bombicola]